MTGLQARVFAGRAVRAVRAQEEEARLLRAADIPSQRGGAGTAAPTLSEVEPVAGT